MIKMTMIMMTKGLSWENDDEHEKANDNDDDKDDKDGEVGA